MNQLATLIIGALLGILAFALLIGIGVIAWLAYVIYKSLLDTRSLTARTIARNTAATDKLRTEVQVALTSMDAERLFAASQSVQRGVKQFSQAVATLQRLVFAAGGDTSAIDQAAQSAGVGMGGYGTSQNPLDPVGFESDISDDYVEPEQQDYHSPFTIHRQEVDTSGMKFKTHVNNTPVFFEQWATRHNPPDSPTQVAKPLPDLPEAEELDAQDRVETGAALPDV